MDVARSPLPPAPTTVLVVSDDPAAALAEAGDVASVHGTPRFLQPDDGWTVAAVDGLLLPALRTADTPLVVAGVDTATSQAAVRLLKPVEETPVTLVFTATEAPVDAALRSRMTVTVTVPPLPLPDAALPFVTLGPLARLAPLLPAAAVDALRTFAAAGTVTDPDGVQRTVAAAAVLAEQPLIRAAGGTTALIAALTATLTAADTPPGTPAGYADAAAFAATVDVAVRAAALHVPVGPLVSLLLHQRVAAAARPR